jgi:hypothetical protein
MGIERSSTAVPHPPQAPPEPPPEEHDLEVVPKSRHYGTRSRAGSLAPRGASTRDPDQTTNTPQTLPNPHRLRQRSATPKPADRVRSILSTLATHSTTFYRTFSLKSTFFDPKKHGQNPKPHPSKPNSVHNSPQLPTNASNSRKFKDRARAIPQNRPQLPTNPNETTLITGAKTSFEPPRQHLRQVHRPRIRILRNLLAATESVTDNHRVFPPPTHCGKQHPLP